MDVVLSRHVLRCAVRRGSSSGSVRRVPTALILVLFLLVACTVATARKRDDNPAVYSVRPVTRQRVALTFDDGPHGTLTPRLMDILKPLKAYVTFFVMGIKVLKHAEILQRAVREGHEVANHVWNHPVLSKIPRAAVFEQMKRTNDAIAAAVGFPPATMRPPYGNTNKKLNQFLEEEGNCTVVMWSYDALDWKHPGKEGETPP